MLYELRQYKAHAGKRDEFVELMNSTILPFQTEKGVEVVANFVSPDDPDAYIWIRRFDSDERRTEVTEAVYGSDYWNDEVLPKVIDLLDRDQTVVTMLSPTEGSALS